MTTRPDFDVLTVLKAEIPQLDGGKNAFTGPKRAINDEDVTGCVVFVLASGGLPDEPIGSPTLGNRVIRKPAVTIRVISDRGDGAFVDSQELARACFEAIDRNPPAGYCDARALNSHPRYAGTLEEGRHEWIIPVALMIDRVLRTVYWGIGSAGLSLEAEVLALPASDLPDSGSAQAANRFREFTANPDGTEKIYYWIPEEYAVPGNVSFKVGALPGGFNFTAVTVNSLPGRLYESDSLGLGPGAVVEVS